MKYIPMRYYSDGNYGEQFQFKFIAKKKGILDNSGPEGNKW